MIKGGVILLASAACLAAVENPNTTLSIDPALVLTITGSPGSFQTLLTSSALDGSQGWHVLTNVTLDGAGNSRVQLSPQNEGSRYYKRFALEGFVGIPPGTFVMGSPVSEALRLQDETQHTVILSQGFWMGQREVTQGEYVSVMGSNPSYFKNGIDAYNSGTGGEVTNELRHPVEQVSWSDATNYCGTLTLKDRAAGRIPADYAYRLPSEAEWEYACRGGTTNAFYFGDAIRQGMANFGAREEYDSAAGSQSQPDNVLMGRTVEVGSYAPNAFGLQDMHGNVSEWCSDLYADFPVSLATDPIGPALGFDRVLRGGYAFSGGQDCRAAVRLKYRPDVRYASIGFRVVIAPVPKGTAFEGRLVDSNKVGLSHASVVVSYRGAALSVSNRTDTDGRFFLKGFAGGYSDQIVLRAYLYKDSDLMAAVQTNLPPSIEGTTNTLGDIVVAPLSPQLVAIPPGTFLMGSPASERLRDSEHETQHTVVLTRGFRMGKFEVTQGEYLSVMGFNPSRFQNGAIADAPGIGGKVTNDLRHPVDRVSWVDATNYCAKLTQRDRASGLISEGYAYRLPTEAEWEYACRGGTTNAFSFGTAIRQGMANYDSRSDYDSAVGGQAKPENAFLGRTTEVGTYLPNAFGLYDMHGNVMEWCLDKFGFFSSGQVVDPIVTTNLDDSDVRVLRGGCYYFKGYQCRAASRFSYIGGGTLSGFGFRVVLAPVR